MAEVTERIAWFAIILGLIMQVFAGLFVGTSIVAQFSNIESFTDGVEAVLTTFLSFITQDWASGFPCLWQVAIAILFDSAILFMLSSNTALLVTTIVAGVIAALAELIPG